MDGRNQNYITYEIEVILNMMLLKNVCSIASMQEMNDTFNEDECVKNIYKILGLKEKEYLPHYVTINECLSKLDTGALEKIRKDMVCSLIRKKSFDDAKFLGKYWLVIVDATQLFCFKERHCEHCLT
ncbi:transposase family protein [Anaerocolumna sp.]|uniref:transposase family protein n=1 Tax=Anaerocolumna sp. TaxID=2041569 RepID=UPI0028A75A9C|nr:transposase family protein [Anaerocolumna sp.]